MHQRGAIVCVWAILILGLAAHAVRADSGVASQFGVTQSCSGPTPSCPDNCGQVRDGNELVGLPEGDSGNIFNSMCPSGTLQQNRARANVLQVNTSLSLQSWSLRDMAPSHILNYSAILDYNYCGNMCYSMGGTCLPTWMTVSTTNNGTLNLNVTALSSCLTQGTCSNVMTGAIFACQHRGSCPCVMRPYYLLFNRIPVVHTSQLDITFESNVTDAVVSSVWPLSSLITDPDNTTLSCSVLNLPAFQTVFINSTLLRIYSNVSGALAAAAHNATSVDRYVYASARLQCRDAYNATASVPLLTTVLNRTAGVTPLPTPPPIPVPVVDGSNCTYYVNCSSNVDNSTVTGNSTVPGNGTYPGTNTTLSSGNVTLTLTTATLTVRSVFVTDFTRAAGVSAAAPATGWRIASLSSESGLQSALQSLSLSMLRTRIYSLSGIACVTTPATQHSTSITVRPPLLSPAHTTQRCCCRCAYSSRSQQRTSLCRRV